MEIVGENLIETRRDAVVVVLYEAQTPRYGLMRMTPSLFNSRTWKMGEAMFCCIMVSENGIDFG